MLRRRLGVERLRPRAQRGGREPDERRFRHARHPPQVHQHDDG
jgi:hypothetical protein